MKTFKTEIVLNPQQQEKYARTVGTCRFVYNLFLQKNKELYEQNKDTDLPTYMNNFDFSKWLNNSFVVENPEYCWIKEVSSKSIRHAIDVANIAFTRFFTKKADSHGLKRKTKMIVECILLKMGQPTLFDVKDIG